ncbi:TAP C-terminal domain-containing protein [Elsinoe fawcettii]|nr:TAP C-terminal domain-containing protein [Elsinoe fawcettii]
MVARKQTGTRAARGGAIAKRRSALRADKDGDVSMDGSTRGRGGISKSKPPTGPASEVTSRKPRAGLTAGRLKAEITRHVSSGAISAKGRSTTTTNRPTELKVTGWPDSKAASGSDGGVSALIIWLEKKATQRNASKRPVKLRKVRIEDDKTLIITVPESQLDTVLRLDQFEWAGNKITIKESDGTSEGTQNTINMLRGVLERRYNPELKLLDLSALGQDPDLKASAIFDSRTTTSKFFPAMMKVLDKQFETQAQKNEAIQSVSLANNDLPNLTTVTTLAQTLPALKNLDISGNQLSKLDDIENWKKKFGHLDHLVISNNPIEQNEPELIKTLVSWYKKLRMLNSIQVRTDEEAAKSTAVGPLPFPIRSPVFQDEGHIAENFVRTFFTGYDTDRAALARLYYDEKSDFSYSINTQAPRDPNATEAIGPQEWDAYIKRSRNLKRLNHLPARQARLSKGVESVIQNWQLLPVTRHPDLAADAKKWLIECQLQPGLPDPTGQSPGGVDGFLVTIHGEFDEIDVSTGQAKKKRSFDRTFIIGPGGPSGVRVINDMLIVRAYGGTQAFEPDDENQVNQPGTDAPGLPTGLTTEVAEKMVLALQEQTGMTVGYAKDCLEQVTWDFDRALQAFAAVRATLPADAFVQAPVVAA